MKYAVIADIHANLPALKAVLADIKTQKCDRVVCLGDLVGYGTNPKECLDIVRGLGIPCVKGNHDEYCSCDGELDGFNPKTATHVVWTRAQLNGADREWLNNLDYVKTVDGFTIVHATLDGPQRWGYVFDKLAAAASFPHQTTTLCFFGHTHVPVAFIRDTVVRGGTYSKFRVEQGKKYFINVGSVGQPRDNIPKAAYVVYDNDQDVIELRRLDYERPDSDGGIGDGAAFPPRRPAPIAGACRESLENSAPTQN